MKEQKLLTTAPLPTVTEMDTEPVLVTEKDLCSLTADLCGILLPLSATGQAEPSSKLITTFSASKSIRDIALAISLKMPILLHGPTGCGKTALIEEAARKLGQRGKLLS
jgi:midasin (ATPase involved in ribosome maturation)